MGVIRPMATSPVSHRFPSGPVVIVVTWGGYTSERLGVAYSVTTPAVVIRPTSPGTPVNQRAPSGPDVMSSSVAGVAAAPGGAPAGGGIVGTANSVTTPVVLIRPTAPGMPTNQSAPSGPAVIAVSVARVSAVPGNDPAGGGTAGMANSVTTPVVLIRPTMPGTPVNHRAPSGPTAIALAVAGVLAVPGNDPAGGGTTGKLNSVTTPAVVIRPILPGTPVNQSAPSGPAAIAVGWGVVLAVPGGDPAGGGTSGRAKLVTTPDGVMRPMRPAPVSVNQRFPSEPVAISSGCTSATRGMGKLVTDRAKSARGSSRRSAESSSQNSLFRLNLRESARPERL